MGMFYGNITLLRTTMEAALAATPVPAFLLADGKSIVVFTEADDQELQSGENLSVALQCIAVGAMVHDDDYLYVTVHDKGQLAFSTTVPDPSEFFADMLDDLDPSMLEEMGISQSHMAGGPPEAARQLVAAVGSGDAAAVEAALNGEYVFAHDRHSALALALGLSPKAAGWGYRYVAESGTDEFGPGLLRV
jgi:hypothetical protein